MVALSDRNNNITVVPTPQSPDRAGMQQQWLGTQANVPDNWLLQDNHSELRSDFPDLFNIIGTKFGEGSDPGNTFAMPYGVWASYVFDLDLSNFTNSFVKNYASGMVSSDGLGNWFLTFWLKIDSGLVTSGSMTFEIEGISLFNPGTKTEQAISVASFNGQPITDMIAFADTGVPTTNRIEIGGEGSHNIFAASGVLRLASKPTDAIVGADANYTTLDETWAYIPIVKGYNDSGSVAISSP